MRNMKKFAFFDADETLLSFKSMFVFKHYLTTQLLTESHLAHQSHDLFMNEIRQMAQTKPREEINKYFYTTLAGFRYEYLNAIAQDWFQSLLFNVYIDKTVTFLKQLKSQKIQPVIVSGSSDFILQPFANDLGVEHLLCARLEVQQGVATGRLLTYPIIGEGKKKAVLDFCNRQNANLKDCFAIGDDISDAPMLESVGQPYIVSNNNANMRQFGLSKGWGIIETPQLNLYPVK